MTEDAPGLFENEPEISAETLSRSRSAVVITDTNIGGCVLVVSGLAISTLHLIVKQKEIRVDRKLAKVVHKNKRQDLVALQVETAPLPWVSICDSPKVGDQILFLVPRYDRRKQVILFPCKGEVTYTHDETICGSMSTAPGTCGMGIFASGLVGIVDSDEKFEFLLAIPARIVIKFAGQAYRKIHQRQPQPAAMQHPLPFAAK